MSRKMKKITILAVIVILLATTTILVAIHNIKPNPPNQPLPPTNTTINSNSEHKNTMNITINQQNYAVVLEDNPTVRMFLQKLPQELTMQELNGNEKYAYLDYSLPTNPSVPDQINAGDIMLYGDNCLVIFYKTFTTSYSYTKIGHIDNLPELGDGTVAIQLAQ